MNADFDDFLEEMRRRPEFRLVHAENAIDGGNLIGVSGDIVGEVAMNELVELGRERGFLVLSDGICVWKSQEDLDLHGARPATELE